MTLKLPSTHLRMAGAALTGVLVVFSFPLFGFEVGLDGLIWVALLPLFLSAAGAGARRGFLLGLVAGLILECAGFIWILLAIRRFTGLPTAVASLLFLCWLLYATLPWGILGAALGRCSCPVNVLWVLPLWVGVEHYFPRLFPWHLGGALYGRQWLLQNADLLGASGLTGLVFLSSAVLFLLLGFLRGKNGFPVISLSVFALFVAGGLIYGRLRVEEVEGAAAQAPRVKVLLVQGALDPAEREERGLEVYLARTREVLRAGEKPDLVVWPEGADPYFFNLTPGGDPWLFHGHRLDGGWRGVRFDRELSVPLVTGAGGLVAGRLPASSNVAAFLAPGKPPAFYEKNKRLLFGEQVPFIDLLPVAVRRDLLGHVGTIAAGTENPRLSLGGASFRSLICYEAVLPDYVRRASGGADFLVNVTEDVWYGRTAHIPQHVSVLILRVVENRVPVVRCANMGPSGVVAMSGRFRRGEKVFEPELIRGEVEARSLPTLYRSGGHFFPLAMLVLAGLRWGVSRGLSRRSLGKR